MCAKLDTDAAELHKHSTLTARGAQTLPADLGRPFVAAPNEKGLPAKSRRSRDYMLICVIASAAKVFGYLFNESETHAATVTAGRHQGK